MREMKFSMSRTNLIPILAGAGFATMAASLALFAWLGTFTRFRADDYCDMALLQSGPLLNGLWNRYQTSSDRFSNLLFVALSNWIDPHSVAWLPAVMLILWTAGLTWLVRETRRAIGWQWPFPADLFPAASIAFFSILQAPNRFQILYWRSAMATHFAPIVYLTFFAAFLLMQIRRSAGRSPAVWMGPLVMVSAFFGGGFSEPPDAILIVTSLLALFAIWIWIHGPSRRPALILLAWTLAGGLLALLVMFLSPWSQHPLASASSEGVPAAAGSPDLPSLIGYTFLYTLQFIQDTVLTLYLPTLMTVIVGFLAAFGVFAYAAALPAPSTRRLLAAMLAALLLMFLLIATSFVPSVYGQHAYPEERARFAARVLLVTALMVEGACLGAWVAQWKNARSPLTSGAVLLLCLVAALYPLRAGWNAVQQKLPLYQRWASAWDIRQTSLLADQAQGLQEVTTFQLHSIEGVKELDPDPTQWVNRCAAAYYGFQSIKAP
jgi:hypothetical protein